MKLGTSIFLSTIIFSFIAFYGITVLLYRITQNSWNWKKIVKGFFCILIIIFTVLSVFLAGKWYFDHKKKVSKNIVKPVEISCILPKKPLTNFVGFMFSHSKSDTKFFHGAPIKEKDSTWIYGDIEISFHENKIKSVIISPMGLALFSLNNNDKRLNFFNKCIQGSYEEIINFLGKPTQIKISKDQLERMLLYDKYNIVVKLRKNNVYAFGIYNSKYGMSY